MVRIHLPRQETSSSWVVGGASGIGKAPCSSLPGTDSSMDREAWWANCPRGCKTSDTAAAEHACAHDASGLGPKGAWAALLCWFHVCPDVSALGQGLGQL